MMYFIIYQPCFSLHSFVLHKIQGANQYVYKLLQSHTSLNTLNYYQG